MALRDPLLHASKRASRVIGPRFAAAHKTCLRLPQLYNTSTHGRSMATVVPPVTQDATSSKGPTAMVFMNMGGPSTTDEVGDFLSRLFVRLPRHGYE